MKNKISKLLLLCIFFSMQIIFAANQSSAMTDEEKGWLKHVYSKQLADILSEGKPLEECLATTMVDTKMNANALKTIKISNKLSEYEFNEGLRQVKMSLLSDYFTAYEYNKPTNTIKYQIKMIIHAEKFNNCYRNSRKLDNIDKEVIETLYEDLKRVEDAVIKRTVQAKQGQSPLKAG